MSFRDIHETRGQFNLRLHTTQCLKNTQKVSFEYLRSWSNWNILLDYNVNFWRENSNYFFKTN